MSNGFETCDQHTYLFATEGKDCPYCEIDRLKAELEEERSSWSLKAVEQFNRADDLERQLAEARASVQQWIKTAGENQLKRNEFADAVEQARREGWEQCQRECVEKIDSEICDCCWGEEAQEASDHLCETIAAMEYNHGN